MVKKFATLDRANSLNIRSCSLPIGNLLKKSRRNALNIDTVACMLSAYVKFKNWEKAYNYSMPKRFLKEDANLEDTGNVFLDGLINVKGMIKEQ